MKRIIFLPAIAALLCGACSSAVPEDYTQYVDPYIGTGDHGHVFMGANVPFGFVQLGPTSIPQTWDWCSGYNYADTTVIGFGHTHLSGTGIGDLNDISLMPVVGKVTPGRGTAGDPSSGMWSRFSRADERCAPGYYATRLLRYGIGVELTASPRVGMSRYAFPASDDAGIVLDLENGQGWDRSTDCGITACSDRTVEGWRYSTGWADDQRVYFHAEFSKPFERIVFTGADTLSADGRSARGRKLYGRFGFRTEENERITVKVGLSAVSAENARRNMQAECPGWDFEAVREATRRAWNGELSKIRIETADPAVRRIFYTALYHTMIAPSLFCDVNGDYRGADGAVRRDTTFTNYTTFSLWDTYRAAHPLLTLIHPEKVGDLINTMLRIHEQQGKLPVWHLMGCETDCMVGNPAIPVVADALLKGFGGFDRAKAYEAMKSSAMRDDRRLDLYKRYGYIPYEFNESVGYCLEYAIADWALAQAAQREGKREDYDYFLARSKAYRHYFDPSTGFIRGRSASGAWRTPFDPFHSRHMEQDYTEGNAWQYTWLVPHDIEGLMECFGGRERFVGKLDSLFLAEGDMGAHASPDISGLIGQYAHGNEPSHHITYIYTMIGQPWKCAEKVRRILGELYHDRPEGLCGNEDVGQMSAWYILSSMGLYSVCPGSNEYVLTTPLFEKVVVHLANGRTLTILANDPQKNIYITKVELNGKQIDTNFITYDCLMGGGELRFTLSDKPNKSRGTAEQTAPYSYTRDKVVSIPYVDKDLNLFQGSVVVELATTTQGAKIRYTLDGSEPTEESFLYKHPFSLNKTTQVKARGFKEGYHPSRVLSIIALKAELKDALSVHPVQNGVTYKYFEGNYQKVTDIEKTPLLRTGVLSKPSIQGASRTDHFGYIFSGLIKVPENGVYTFQTSSDDGSVLYIDNELVVNNDGSHAAIPATGFIALEKGFHSYKLYYFEDYEGEHLSWAWKLPSAETLVPIPSSVLYVE